MRQLAHADGCSELLLLDIVDFDPVQAGIGEVDALADGVEDDIGESLTRAGVERDGDDRDQATRRAVVLVGVNVTRDIDGLRRKHGEI